MENVRINDASGDRSNKIRQGNELYKARDDRIYYIRQVIDTALTTLEDLKSTTDKTHYLKVAGIIVRTTLKFCSAVSS